MENRTTIVGNGLIASAFKKVTFGARPVVVFASGVANSLEQDEAEFARERDLLTEVRNGFPQATVLYFGTCSVYDHDRIHTPYVQHKLKLESVLANMTGNFLIFRLPLAIGSRERAKTLPHFLFDCIRHGKQFDVWARAVRYPIDVDDVVRIAARFLADDTFKSRIVNVAFRAFPVIQFVRIFESILGKKALINLVDRGGAYRIDCPELVQLASELNLDFSEAYLERVLRKYFVSRCEVRPTF